jgi:site-specific DNA-cytosine methylase
MLKVLELFAGISNSQLYKQAGNSIVVNVLEGILKNLLMEQP